MKRRLQKAFRLTILLLLFASSLIGQQLDHVLGECLVQFGDDNNAQTLVSDLTHQYQSDKFQIHQISSAPVNIWSLRFDHVTINAYDFLADLRQNRYLQLAQFNHFVSNRTIPNDPQFDSQWQYINEGQSGGTSNSDLDAELAWSISTGGLTDDGDTIVVCIIDEGIDPFHEDLHQNLWKNYNEIPDNGIDDDNNGYIDDYGGWNVVNMDDDLTSGNNPGWHGTPVAGIIGARGNNNLGVSGVNWNIKLMVVVRGITEAQAIAAYAYPFVQRKKYNETNGDEGTFVVATNTSWGIDFGQPEDAPLWCAFYDSLGTVGILDAAATINGNFNVDQFGDLPTSCPSDFLVSVTNINHHDVKNPNAGYGLESIDIGAFGTDVWTLKKNNSYGSFTGTSAAAPHVAGAIALLYSSPCPDISWLAKNAPDATALLMKNYLMDGATQNDNLSNLVKSGGRLNLSNSMQLLMDNCAFTACFPPSLISTSDIALSGATVNWLAGSNIISVNLKYRELGNTVWIDASAIESPHTLSNLLPCTAYEYTLQSICGGGQSPVSPVHIFKTDGCCEAPDPIFIENLSPTSVFISWPDQTVAESYYVRYRAVGGVWIELACNVNELTIENLEPCSPYEIQVSTLCQGGSATEYSPLLLFETTGCSYCLEGDYCTTGGMGTLLSWLSRVVVNDLDNSSENSVGGYTDFTMHAANLLQGYFHDFTIESDYDFVQIPLYIQIWIDYNQDGIFTGNDLAFQTNIAVSEISGSFNIPPNALLGNTRMRVIGSTEIIDPCDSLMAAGEMEDYCVNIVTQNECLAPVGYSIIPGVNNVTLSWTGSLTTDEYSIRYREPGSEDWNYINTTLHYLTVQSLTACTDYELQIQSDCDGENSAYSPLQYFSTIGCGACLDMDYCQPSAASSIFEWIAFFELNEIQDSSGSEGYNFTGASTDLIQGEEYAFLIQPGFAGDIYEEHYSIWIDYNRDGTFTDISEKVYDSGTASTNSNIIGQFTVPDFSSQGSTRLRVSMKYQHAPDNACEGAFDGEIQDYCVNIYSSPSQLCNTPPNIILDGVFDTTAFVSWSENPSAISYQFRYKHVNSSALEWNVITSNNTFFNMDDLDICEDYLYQVRTICDTGLSSFSAPSYFTTECLTNTTSEEDAQKTVRVYPNPFSDFIKIEFGGPYSGDVISVEVYHISGQLVKQRQFSNAASVELSLKGNPEGIYFVEITDGVERWVEKVVLVEE